MGEMKDDLEKQTQRAKEAGKEFENVEKQMAEAKSQKEEIEKLEKEVKIKEKEDEPKHWIWVTLFAGVAFYHVLYYWRLRGEKQFEDRCAQVLNERMEEELDKIQAATPEFLETNTKIFLSNYGVEVLKSQFQTGKVSFKTVQAEIGQFKEEITENYSKWVVSPELKKVKMKMKKKKKKKKKKNENK
eukprot:CAMPEP_0201518902 /NCGR_PEP_ID=MMETSP0161_2-20130828/9619_1 /ASSEMBLY_ACC=CAM_ASM_000251 /TAXON_ID=180227 /ORGANISM="Neoparamoeba aestuarina, Strain SoJaBio B1-5/56/2" /LENGTH=186 /DNA_ID=CAMNT_0047916811 /DNA_START=296 /DNA_END=854 /DNA_ORIENTATION=+